MRSRRTARLGKSGGRLVELTTAEHPPSDLTDMPYSSDRSRRQFGTVAFYMVAGLVMVTVNKWVRQFLFGNALSCQPLFSSTTDLQEPPSLRSSSRARCPSSSSLPSWRSLLFSLEYRTCPVYLSSPGAVAPCEDVRSGLSAALAIYGTLTFRRPRRQIQYNDSQEPLEAHRPQRKCTASNPSHRQTSYADSLRHAQVTGLCCSSAASLTPANASVLHWADLSVAILVNNFTLQYVDASFYQVRIRPLPREG